MATISCVMITRNCINQGYPFKQAIAASLPLCDEFIVVDGLSTDGTFEVLRSLRNSKIKIFQDEWSDHGKKSEVIRDAINHAIGRASGNYIFHVDANEIIDPEALERIRELPIVFPETTLFALPYYQFMGKYLFNEEFRIRFGKKSSSIVSVDDGWTLGTKIGGMDFLKRILHPGSYMSALYNFTGNLYFPSYFRYVHLPKPIFRYYSIDPELLLTKLESRSRIHSGEWSLFSKTNPRIMDMLTRYGSTKDKDNFWRSMCEYFYELKRAGHVVPKEVIEWKYFATKLHPSVIQDLL